MRWGAATDDRKLSKCALTERTENGGDVLWHPRGIGSVFRGKDSRSPTKDVMAGPTGSDWSRQCYNVLAL